jgi:photosystem II stability/assembly factor-like uncharacterized protein
MKKIKRNYMKHFIRSDNQIEKIRIVLLMLFIMLRCFLLSSASFAQTNVSGILWTDTTWTRSGSPYYVIGDVQVPSGVRLTIEPGVRVEYMGNYELLIKGYLKAQGTLTDSITLVGSGTKVKFVGTNLDSSSISYVRISGSGRAIMVGSGGGEFNPGEPCTGTLTVSHITIEGGEVRTGGYQTSAALVLRDAVLKSVTVIGQYPRSEPISIINAIITNSSIISDSYNAGITLENALVTNSQLRIGCCGGNLRLRGCTVFASTIGEGGGSPVGGPLEVTDSKLIATSINLPAATVFITNSIIDHKGSGGLRFGNGSINQSTVTGADTGIGVEITGYAGYNIGGSVNLTNVTIVHNSVGVKVTGGNSMTIQGSNFVDNTTYNIENRSATPILASDNFWGTTDSLQIASMIFDYNDDINYGPVQLQNNLASPDTIAPVAPPRNVVKRAVTGGVELRWSANKESDLAGYKIYYGSPTRYSFAHVVDVGNVTSYTLAGVSVSDTIAVTAYDIHADGSNDQIEGHESWFAIAGPPVPQIRLSKSSIDFNITVVGDSAVQTLSIENTGSADLVISNITSSNSVFTVTPTFFTVPPDSSKLVTVKFAPVTTGVVSGTLLINHNASGSPLMVSVRGTGVSTSGTGVQGIVLTNTTWTRSGSPYYVIGDVQVPSGVRLTIEPGVRVEYMGNYELLIKGYLKAQGTLTDSITLVGSGTKVKFVGTNLDSSSISYVRISGSGRAIMVGSGGGEFNPGEPCTGTLTVSHITIEGGEVRTGGYQTSAALVLRDAVLKSVTVIGQYPRSEPISIINAIITNSSIISDSYNAGITLENALVTNSQLRIGCCGGNLRLRGCTVFASTIGEGGGSPVGGPLEVTDSKLIATSINLPAATVFITNSIIDHKGSGGLRFGNGSINQSTVTGADTGIGVEITGYAGYNIGGSVNLTNVTIVHNSVGVKVTGGNSMTIQGSNFVDNTTYNIENRSATPILASDNFWGTTDSLQIASMIFDYNDDINYGPVQLQNNLASPDTIAPVAPPRNVVKRAVTGGVELRWSANKESDLAGYKIYYGSPTRYSFAHVVDVGNVTSYTLAGVSVSDTIAVTAYDIHADGNNDQIEGHESWFAIAKDYSTPAVPILNYPPNGQTVLSLEPTLIWTSSNGAEKYQLQVALDSLFVEIIYDIPNITDVFYKIGPLLSQTTYYWRVRASNKNGTSAYSSIWKFSTVDTSTLLWNMLNSGTIRNLYGIFSINQNLIFAVGAEGTIMRTSDGGITWSNLNSGTTSTLYSVFFTDSLKGWVVGSGGTILHTTDQGETWSTQNSGTDKPLYSVFFKDDSSGTVVGGGIILNTTNGGLTWEIQFTPSSKFSSSGSLFASSPQTDYLLNVVFVNSLNGYAVGGSGKLLRTTDGGKTWTSQTTGTTNDLWAIAFADAQNGFAVGTFGTILRTTDGGTSWNIINSGTDNHLYAVRFSDASTGIVVGAKGTVLRTTNGGLTWTQEIVGTANWLRGVALHSKNTNIIVGSNGLILKPFDKMTSVDKHTLAGIPEVFQLYQNYPNPFNPSTTIEFDIPERTNVKLVIYDILGREVETIIDKELEPGKYKINFTATNLPSGVYFYTLKTPKFTKTNKMLLIK